MKTVWIYSKDGARSHSKLEIRGKRSHRPTTLTAWWSNYLDKEVSRAQLMPAELRLLRKVLETREAELVAGGFLAAEGKVKP
jgi:hypothetical protein